ncbi:MAG: peptidylprolyl isomerase [Myxococcota bacterium]
MRRVLLPSVAALLVVVVSTPACEPDKPDVLEAKREEAIRRADEARKAAKEGAGAVERLAAPAGIDEETAAKPVATLDGRTVLTVGDLARYMARLPTHLRARYARADQREELLKHMVELEVLAREAKREGLDEHPRVQHALKEALARQLLTTAPPLTGSVADIPEEEVAAWYQDHRDEFVQPERRRVALLMVNTEEDARRLRGRITDAISEQPRMARQIFGDFVEEHSIDRETRPDKGDLGWFDRQGLSPEGQTRADDAVTSHAFDLDRVGAVSEPFQLSNEAWVVVQLTNRRPRRAQDLDQVRFRIQNAILQERQAEERERFIASLKEEAEVEVHADRLDLLPGGAPDGEAGDEDASSEESGEGSEASEEPRLNLDPRALRGRPDLRPTTEDARRLPAEVQHELRLRGEEVQEKMRPKNSEEESP